MTRSHNSRTFRLSKRSSAAILAQWPALPVKSLRMASATPRANGSSSRCCRDSPGAFSLSYLADLGHGFISDDFAWIEHARPESRAPSIPEPRPVRLVPASSYVVVKSSERSKIGRLEDAMRIASLVAVAAFVSLTTLEGQGKPAALQAKPLSEQSAAASPAQKAPKNPYDRLFVPATAFALQPSESRVPQPASQTATTVVCGMRIIPVDPTIDRGIAIPPPDADRYTLRVVKPSVCTR